MLAQEIDVSRGTISAGERSNTSRQTASGKDADLKVQSSQPQSRRNVRIQRREPPPRNAATALWRTAWSWVEVESSYVPWTTDLVRLLSDESLSTVPRLTRSRSDRGRPSKSDSTGYVHRRVDDGMCLAGPRNRRFQLRKT